jgi:hypothetical protein
MHNQCHRRWGAWPARGPKTSEAVCVADGLGTQIQSSAVEGRAHPGVLRHGDSPAEVQGCHAHRATPPSRPRTCGRAAPQVLHALVSGGGSDTHRYYPQACCASLQGPAAWPLALLDAAHYPLLEAALVGAMAAPDCGESLQTVVRRSCRGRLSAPVTRATLCCSTRRTLCCA